MWYDTGQLLFQVPTTVSEYGPGTAVKIARPKTAVVERVKNLRGWLIYDVVVNLKSFEIHHVAQKSADNTN